MTERDLFLQALEITNPAERAAFLDRACAADPSLRVQVDQLLQAHEQAGQFLDPPHPVAGSLEHTAPYVAPSSAAETAGMVIAGKYKLLEQIGEGGMGSVWAAEQTEPVRRKVAIKLIKPGMDSRQVIARFEAERQALALMDHASIARVLDGGLTEAGRPFFVMDLVKGVPITRYCDDCRLSVPERLALFAQVCQAVQHAHQKGIIHRDLKPSNILVALYDDRPVAKVIDFGLAKAMYQPLTDQTLHTAHDMVLGTPLYMSPEQAQLNNLDVDTRTDIYALGVVLYELLTGTTPLEHKRFKQAAWEEMRRIIREEEPPRPSARLSSIDTLPSLAACRHTEPARLTKLVRGELDWIAMKALEKDRNRRYETANGFAMDVQRFLAGEPVLAAPPSATYRLRKLTRKYRAALTTAAVIVLLLVAGITASAWQAVRATKAEGRARVAAEQALAAQQAEARRAESEASAKQEALAAAQGERKARAQAQKRLSQVEKSNEIITSIFTDLDLEDVKKGTEPLEVVLGQRLLKAANDLEGEAVGDPLVVAALQHRLGQSLMHLGLAEQAMSLLTKARGTRTTSLGGDHPDTLKSMNELGVAHLRAGKLDQAQALFEETLKLRRARLGPEHTDTIESMSNLAVAYVEAHKPDKALPLAEETVKLRKIKSGVEDEETLTSMNNLALLYGDLGKLDQARALFEETLKLRKAKQGLDRRFMTLVTMGNLAGVYKDIGRLDLALPLLEETVRLSRARMGNGHLHTMIYMGLLGIAYQEAGKLDLAVPLLEETVQSMKAKLGAGHPRTIVNMNNLATAYQDAGKLDRALPLLEETLKSSTAKFGSGDPNTIAAMGNLAKCYQAAGKLDRALPLFEETLKTARAKLGPEHNVTLVTMANLATAYRAAGKLERALPLLQEPARSMEKKRFQPGNAVAFVNSLIICHEELKQFDQAEAWRRKWLAVLKARAGAESPAYTGALAGLGLNLLKQEKWTDAEAAVRECLTIRQKKEPDVWTTFRTQSMLGQALLRQKKYADAEKHLLSGYEGMQQRAAKIPPNQKSMRLNEALGYIVQLYDATDKKGEADKWRQKLEEAKQVEAKQVK
jgi:serine/threonine protein kinase/tetratricopeptide (TPR) repeat protein